MQNKPFVSLYFFQTKLQVVLLDEEKIQVRLMVTIDLPSDNIINNRVIYPKQLSEILIRIWRQYHLSYRSVGIAIPEFSTFTKTLMLPNLQENELDEAVRWQAQEYLPSGKTNAIMDWKIVRRDKDGLQILTVAITKDVLSGYVDAASMAGLLPVVVETPSLSLERLVRNENEDFGKIIIYTNYGEAILAFVRGQEIIGSAVVPSNNTQQVAATTAQMIQHYKDVEVKKIYIGGTEISNNHMALLEKLGRSIEWLDPRVSGLSPKDAQTYLIPISLQRKDTFSPRDNRTVNLLPMEWASEYDRERNRSQLWTAILIVSLTLWICFLFSIGMYFYFINQVRLHQKPLQQDITQSLQDKLNSINDLSNQVIKIKQLVKNSQIPRLILQKAVTTGVKIDEYQMNLDVGTVHIKGKADSRDALLTFKQNLEKEKDFSKIEIPLTSYTGDIDIIFTVDFTYLPFTAKKPVKLKI